MSFVLRIRRAETPFYAALKRLAKGFATFEIPGLVILAPVLRAISFLGSSAVAAGRRILVALYRAPLFRSRCVSVGKNLYLEQSPSVSGHARISIGDDVCISGDLVIVSSHVFDDPEVIIGKRVFIGHQVTIHASKRVTIEDGALISALCYIADSDDHPHDRDLRARGLPAPPDEIRPVHIGRDAWIGRGCFVLKGVTIGEGAIVGAGSVVRNDVPRFSIAVGNPARTVMRLPSSE
jgi:acetyltransferase-like isoleucine patch superfamily enzyme